MALSNVALTDTFDYHRTVTNSLVTALNGSLFYGNTTNANTVSISQSVPRGGYLNVNIITTSSVLDVSPSNIASTLAVNTAYGFAWAWSNAANSNAFISVASSNAWTNAVGLAANTWANTIGTAGNNYASILAANNAVGANNWANTVSISANSWANTVAISANNWANTKLSNTAGITLAGDLTIPANTFSRIYYDLDNTLYYINPFGWSNLLYANTTNVATSNVLVSGNTSSKLFFDYDNPAYYLKPSTSSKANNVIFDNGVWNTSAEGYNRFKFLTSNATYIMGGTTSQWWLRLGTQDNDTRSMFTSAGDFYTLGNVTAYWSDKRLKKNITLIDDWRTILDGIHGYRFEWNDIGNKLLDNTEDGVQVGLLAQEVKSVLPQAATVQMLQYKDKSGDTLIPRDDIDYDPENPYLTVREEKIIPVLVQAIKGLMAELDEIKKKLP